MFPSARATLSELLCIAEVLAVHPDDSKPVVPDESELPQASFRASACNTFGEQLTVYFDALSGLGFLNHSKLGKCLPCGPGRGPFCVLMAPMNDVSGAAVEPTRYQAGFLTTLRKLGEVDETQWIEFAWSFGQRVLQHDHAKAAPPACKQEAVAASVHSPEEEAPATRPPERSTLTRSSSLEGQLQPREHERHEGERCQDEPLVPSRRAGRHAVAGRAAVPAAGAAQLRVRRDFNELRGLACAELPLEVACMGLPMAGEGTGGRPKRCRLPPLQSWRGEHLVYERLPGSATAVIKGVVRNEAGRAPAN